MTSRLARDCARQSNHWILGSSPRMTGKKVARLGATLRTTHLPYRASTFIAASNPLSVVGNILSSPTISRIIPVLWL